jgi:hypothetical protein
MRNECSDWVHSDPSEVVKNQVARSLTGWNPVLYRVTSYVWVPGFYPLSPFKKALTSDRIEKQATRSIQIAHPIARVRIYLHPKEVAPNVGSPSIPPECSWQSTKAKQAKQNTQAPPSPTQKKKKRTPTARIRSYMSSTRI